MLDAGLPLSSRRLLSLDAGLPNASFRLNKEIIDEVCVTQVSLTSLTKSPSRVTRSPSRVTKSPFPAPHEGDLRHELGRMLLLQHRETCVEGDLVNVSSEEGDLPQLPLEENPNSFFFQSASHLFGSVCAHSGQVL